MTLTPEMIFTIAGLLVGCISILGSVVAVLWRQQNSNQKRCEQENTRIVKKVDELDRFQRTELVTMSRDTAALAASSTALMDRGRRVLERLEKKYPGGPDETPVMGNQTPLPGL
jgi:hypothetical protein